MSCMRRSMFLVVVGACFSLLWPEGSGAQEAPPIEWLDEPSVQSDQRLRIDTSRPRARRRVTIGDASPPFRPPVTSSPNQGIVGGGWQLGIHADKTDTGMLITSVVRGSAAARAGLERGDRILAVGTERVGLVGNRSTSMRKVLRRQADWQGDVLLLVKPRRNRGLINVSVRLDGNGRPVLFGN
jgi:PDZ domain